MAALIEELEVRRHARHGLATGVAVALLVFLLFAYLPGTEETLWYWAALSFVLASAVAGLVTTVLVARAAVRRTRSVHDIERQRSPATLSVLVGLVGWLAVPVAAAVLLDRPGAGVRLVVALATGSFVGLAVGGLAVRLAEALSITHAWRPRAAAAGAVAYTAVLAAPAAGCPAGGSCLDTPDRLVAAVVGLDPGAVAPSYVAVVATGGLAVGAAIGLRGATPANAVASGGVAAVATLPIAAATAGDPDTVRTTALYLPVLAGGLAGIGAAAVLAARSGEGSPER